MSFASKQFKLREKPSLGWTTRKKKKKKNHEIFFFSHFQNSFTRLIEIANVRPQPLFPFKTFRQFFFIWRPKFFFVFQKIRLGNKVFFPGSGKPKYLLEFFRPSFASFRSISRLSNEIVTDERRWEVQVRNKKGEKMFSNKQWLLQQVGMLTTCCNPSHGTLLFGWVQGTGCWLGHSQPWRGGRHKASVLLYHSATVPGRWKGQKNKARSVACQVKHQVALVERKVVGSSQEEDVASFPSSFRIKIDLCRVPILVCWYSIIVMWQLSIDGIYCNFTSKI